MTKKRLLILLGALVLVGLVIIIVIGGPGKFLQGALYNIRPIYRECRIEGQNFNSTNTADCENFNKKLQDRYFPSGEYTIYAKYTDRRLPDNIIPVTVTENQLECNFLGNGYEPQINVSDARNPLASETIKNREEVPVGSNGVIVQINYRKNDQPYVYDSNICESAFRATLLDADKKELGQAKMDYNGFVNSRELVNEIMITDKPYYSDQTGQPIRDFQAGNIYASLNLAPDFLFKFTLPCSGQKISVEIPNLETNQDILIPIKGLSAGYLKNCGTRLYLGLQNTNRYDDIQIIQNLNLVNQGELTTYFLKLSQIGRLSDINTTFPISFKINLHLRDRSDSQEVITLGSGLLTITGYKAETAGTETAAGTTGPVVNTELITDQNATAEIQTNTTTVDATNPTETPPADPVTGTTTPAETVTDPAPAEEIDPAPITPPAEPVPADGDTTKVRRNPLLP